MNRNMYGHFIDLRNHVQELIFTQRDMQYVLPLFIFYIHLFHIHLKYCSYLEKNNIQLTLSI